MRPRAAAVSILRRLVPAALAVGLCGLVVPVQADSGELRQSLPQGADIGATRNHAPGHGHDCGSYYPDLSRRLREAGDVVVRYDIGVDGAVSNVQLVLSSGFKRLDESALACVATTWRGVPLVKDGVAVALPGHQALIGFSLSGVDSAERMVQRGMAQETMGDHRRAIDAFTQAIAADPDDAQTYRARAAAYEALGQHDLAVADTARADALGDGH